MQQQPSGCTSVCGTASRGEIGGNIPAYLLEGVPQPGSSIGPQQPVLSNAGCQGDLCSTYARIPADVIAAAGFEQLLLGHQILRQNVSCWKESINDLLPAECYMSCVPLTLVACATEPGAVGSISRTMWNSAAQICHWIRTQEASEVRLPEFKTQRCEASQFAAFATQWRTS